MFVVVNLPAVSDIISTEGDIIELQFTYDRSWESTALESVINLNRDSIAFLTRDKSFTFIFIRKIFLYF